MRTINIYIVILLAAFALVKGNAQECGSFQPEAGKYYVSGWVKETNADNAQVQTYDKSFIRVSFTGDTTVFTFSPVGRIIDGWQRIIGQFEVKNEATAINIELLSVNLGEFSYFDDIRVVPFNGNLKSFVYDPETQRLVAELDENNFATFYEYDKEGGLIRVKKETIEGVQTIQETRSGNSKTNTDD